MWVYCECVSGWVGGLVSGWSWPNQLGTEMQAAVLRERSKDGRATRTCPHTHTHTHTDTHAQHTHAQTLNTHKTHLNDVTAHGSAAQPAHVVDVEARLLVLVIVARAVAPAPVLEVLLPLLLVQLVEALRIKESLCGVEGEKRV